MVVFFNMAALPVRMSAPQIHASRQEPSKQASARRPSSQSIAVLVAIGASAIISSACGDALALGGPLFQRSCAGCHSGGGNVVQPTATLQAKDLERNGIFSLDDIFNITYSGKGRMPGFGEKCTPRGQCTFGPRLSDDEIRALAEYVKLQSEQGWSSR